MATPLDRPRFDPEIVFETLPESFKAPSAIAQIERRENTAGVVFPADRAAFRAAFDAYANGEVKAFECSGMVGAKEPQFYEATWKAAFDRLEKVGYFSKARNVDGLHPNVFDTLVEGYALEGSWILKLTYNEGDGIDAALAEHVGSYTALTAAGIELSFAPADIWWYNIDLLQVLEPLGISETAIDQVAESLHNSKTMKNHLLLAFQQGEKRYPLQLSMIFNQTIGRLHPRYNRRVENRIQGPAWDRRLPKIFSDPPRLLLLLTKPNQSKSGEQSRDFLLTHIWKKEEVAEICQAREEMIRRLEPLIEQKPLWKSN